MLCAPDFASSDEDGFSDDCDYYEFKTRIRNNYMTNDSNKVKTAAELREERLKSLFSAISYGRTQVVIDELNKGDIDINADLKMGWTPLLLAATVANEQIISELLERGANVNQSQDDSTALMLACSFTSEDESTSKKVLNVVTLLLKSGADVSLIDRKRRTALMLAAHNGHLEVVKLLLPLSDIEAEDNQRWTALFWAVDGKKLEVVEFLLSEKASCDKIDIRGNTVIDIARAIGADDVLNVLPIDYAGEEIHLNLTSLPDFTQIFVDLCDGKPRFFHEICKILFGLRSEDSILIFKDHNLSLFNFLSLTNTELEKMGIELPYQRNRILSGLYRFHKHPYNPKSIPFAPKEGIYTNIDVSLNVLACVRQVISMEASLNFFIKNSKEDFDLKASREIGIKLSKIRNQIKRFKLLTEQFVKTTETWDSTIKPVDLITKKRRNIPWSTLVVSSAIASSIGLFIFCSVKTD